MISNPSEKLTYYARSMLPFSDAASPNLPLSRLFRLSLFQVSVGMATVLLLGTLNRVMIVELGISAFLVALMIALPGLINKSKTMSSQIPFGPYLIFGTVAYLILRNYFFLFN